MPTKRILKKNTRVSSKKQIEYPYNPYIEGKRLSYDLRPATAYKPYEKFNTYSSNYVEINGHKLDFQYVSGDKTRTFMVLCPRANDKLIAIVKISPTTTMTDLIPKIKKHEGLLTYQRKTKTIGYQPKTKKKTVKK